MAYGNLIDYEDGPLPGTTVFKDKFGKGTLMHGGPAEDLKRRLDESAAMMPQPTAALTPAQRIAAMNVQAGQAAMPAGTGELGAQEARLDARAAAGAQARADAAAAGQPAATPTAPATGPAPGGVRSLGGGRYEKDGIVGQFRGPSRGSPGGLALTSETRQGVQPLDPELAGSLEENRAAQEAALQERQDAELAQAERNAEHQSELRRVAINQEREAQAQEAEVSRQVGDLQSKYDKAEKDVASSKVDPRGGATFLDAIAVGLGAIGANLGKHENFAQQVVQAKINRHIAAQEHAINIKRETKNDFAHMLEVTKGDRKLARQALDAAYTKKAQAVFEARAAGTGDKMLRATHQQQALQFQEANLLKRKALEDEARGQITQAYVNRPAVAASAGGFVADPDQLATRGKLLDIKKKEQELAAGPDGGKATAGGADKAKRMSAINSSIVALDEYVETSGKAGTVYTTGIGSDQTSKDLGAAAGAMGPMIARATEGDAATADSMKRVIGGLTATSQEARKAAIDAYKAQLLRQKAAIESE